MTACFIVLQYVLLTLLYLSCGYRQRHHPHPEDKIAGGSYVQDIRNFPWIVSMKIDQAHECGGGLLTLSFVITACHCVANISDADNAMAKPSFILKLDAYKFIAGSANIIDYEKNVQIRQAESIHYHPKCRNLKQNLVYDTGLAKMRKPFIRTPYVQPCKMYTWDQEEFKNKFEDMFRTDNPKCMVAGWGDPRKGNHTQNIATTQLKTLHMGVMAEKDCELEWQETSPDEPFNFWEYGQICAVSETANESDCAGDSGSPYVCDGYLIATVSYGADECAEGAPSIYQTVSVLFDWVRENFPEMFSARLDAPPSSHLPKKHMRKSIQSAQAIKAHEGLTVLALALMAGLARDLNL